VHDTFGNALVVETVDLWPLVVYKCLGGEKKSYLLSSKVVLEKHRTSVVLVDYAKPIIRVRLLGAGIACDSPALVVNIFSILLEIIGLLAVLTRDGVLHRLSRAGEQFLSHNC